MGVGADTVSLPSNIANQSNILLYRNMVIHTGGNIGDAVTAFPLITTLFGSYSVLP